MPFLTLFAAYFLASYFGLYLYSHGHTFPGLIWPAAGVAMAGLILGGRRLWPAVAMAGFIAYYASGSALAPAVLLALAHTAQALVGAWLLNWLRFDTVLSRLQDAIAISVTALIPTLIVPTASVLIRVYVVQNLPAAAFGAVWGPLWVGQIFSIIVVMPLIVRWFSRFRFGRTRTEVFEIWTSLGALVLVSVTLFWTTYTQVEGVSLVYLLLIPFFWIALRVGPRFMTVAIFLNACIALAGVVWGPSGADPALLGTRLLQDEIFSSILSFIFLVVATTVEERKDVSKAIGKQVVRLEDALARIRSEDAAKSEFIAVLAHELRNPLAPIVSSVELLEIGELDPAEKKRWLGVIENHARAMRRLLDDLLDVSRISNRKLRLEKEPTDLVEVIRLSVLASRPLIESRNHQVKFKHSHDTLMVYGDPVRLEQIVVNLLNNAAKYTEPGGTITVSARRAERAVTVSVRDTGTGIAPQMLPRIFEPFVQAGKQKPELAGLGIGLALTKRLVSLHGGGIEAKSEGIGHGSEFIISLPSAGRMKIPALAPASGPKPPLFSMQTPYRILIVDDNEAAAEALAKLLEYRGHTVRILNRGNEVLMVVPEYAPEVVILDIGLPDVDGYEVARSLRNEAETNATLIALTGYGQYEDRERAQEAGFDFHLTKPAGLRDIEAILANLPKKAPSAPGKRSKNKK